ncbi:hypothetical protein ACM14_04115 [Delftia sp. JD2]|nr:hypothetical protein ACM14_04115 [Delftia sp. JD2]
MIRLGFVGVNIYSAVAGTASGFAQKQGELECVCKFQAQHACQCPRFGGDVGTVVVTQEFQCMVRLDCID